MMANLHLSKNLQTLPRAPPNTQFHSFLILTWILPKALMTMKKQMQMTPLALQSRRESEIFRERPEV